MACLRASGPKGMPLLTLSARKKIGLGAGRRDLHRVVVEDLHLLVDILDIHGVDDERAATRFPQALQDPDHVVGDELVAEIVLDAGSDMERPDLAVL